ncbi:MAG TPA: hypothetical protein VGQ81_11790 [Acidobacteriota bacterium]|nr:hypothetical protein [Acidobacteriota bacterium]
MVEPNEPSIHRSGAVGPWAQPKVSLVIGHRSSVIGHRSSVIGHR